MFQIRVKIFYLFILTLYFTNVSCIPTEKFYPFGPENGDTALSKSTQETNSPEIQLTVPVKFYSETYSSLYVNSNGLISFITPLQTFVSLQFPLDYPVIAALYANTDIRAAGAIYYRQTQDASLLQKANQEIWQAFPNSAKSFVAKSIFIATWLQVGYFDRKVDKVNSFQVAIISNDDTSYVEFLYADNGIQWIQGEGVPGTGLPDAKAQAGFVAANGRMYNLPGSGTDQVRNLIRMSNANEAGLWVFKVGEFDNDTNVQAPIASQILSEQVANGEQRQSCATSFGLCHSQASCVDSEIGFCCVCRQGFYGNGFNCLKEGHPLRAIGKVVAEINGIKMSKLELQAYIVAQDGRVYTALSKITPKIGYDLQLLYPVTAVLNWLFAKPTGNGLNGFQITGGILNHSAEIIYRETKNRVSVTQHYFGLDVFDQLKMEAYIKGTVPQNINKNTKLMINDYQEQFNFVPPGIFRSSSPLMYSKMDASGVAEEQQEISLDQIITFNESCSRNPTAGSAGSKNLYSYYRVKTARNFNTYEANENILRFAATSKVSLLTENEDPCIEGKVKCVANSSCVVEGDTFRCICNPGFQTTYANRYTDNNNNNEFGCLDVNECVEGKASCDVNAICVNEIGSYQCTCKPGFSGNGYSCSEIESPCVKNPASCNPPNSKCTDPTDPSTCNCNSGFEKRQITDQGDFTCVDLNECEYENRGGRLCEENAFCVNRVGTYSCECKSGYSLDGNSCQKTAGASCNVLKDCSSNGECLYNETAQEYTCHCIRGYYGDGYQCQPYGGRKVVNKLCFGGTGTCICPPSYIVVRNVCVEPDLNLPTEISTVSCNILNSMCHPHAQCVYNATSQQHQCICDAGYEGNGMECSQTEVSCLRHEICDSHASCVTDQGTGKAKCVCEPPFVGDGIHCIISGMCNSDGDCGENEECNYSEKSQTYECRCKSGFLRILNSTVCHQIIKCPSCHTYGQCVIDSLTTDGHCECLPGYRGDGIYACDRIPLSCNVTNYCSSYATCVYNAVDNLFQCQCRQGFIGNGTQCQRIQTCRVNPELCDKNARCIFRRYDEQPFCQCNPGYTGNGSYCGEIEKGGFLFVNQGMSTLKVPFQPNTTNPGYPIQFQANQIATGLTIDCAEGNVYWSDYIGQKIKSATYKGKNVKTLVSSGITAPEGLSVDWISKTIYWTDSGKKVIESINLDGTDRKVIISKNLTNPRGIAVHPHRRKIFWSDWNRAQPKIEWSNLDGSERSIFLYGPDVQLPNSVAIDWSTDELCWADAGTKRITCASIEDRVQRLITLNLSSPFGLTVSPDKYYWTDWTLGKVGYYDRYNRKAENLTLPLLGSGALYGIVAVPVDCP